MIVRLHLYVFVCACAERCAFITQILWNVLPLKCCHVYLTKQMFDSSTHLTPISMAFRMCYSQSNLYKSWHASFCFYDANIHITPIHHILNLTSPFYIFRQCWWQLPRHVYNKWYYLYVPVSIEISIWLCKHGKNLRYLLVVQTFLYS